MTRYGFYFLAESKIITFIDYLLYVRHCTWYPYIPVHLILYNSPVSKVGGYYFHFTDQEIKFRDAPQSHCNFEFEFRSICLPTTLFFKLPQFCGSINVLHSNV